MVLHLLCTGPSDDVTGGGNYMYMEASCSGGCAGRTFVLNTQSIDLSALSSPQLRFFHHMYGTDVGTLTVDVSNDNGATYTNVFTQSGNQGNQWNEELVTLNYTGIVSFKITGVRASGWSSDIAIDNFEVREAPSCGDPSGFDSFKCNYFICRYIMDCRWN